MTELEEMIAEVCAGLDTAAPSASLKGAECASTPSPLAPDGFVQEMNDTGMAVPRGLFNKAEPAVELKREKFEHRNICFLKAQGYSNVEIAELVGYTPVAVAYVVKQPWAEALILDCIHRNGEDGVRKMLRDEAPKALSRLLEIEKSKDAPLEVRRKINENILNRVYGMPSQPVEHKKVVDPNTLPDAELMKMLSPETLERFASAKMN